MNDDFKAGMTYVLTGFVSKPKGKIFDNVLHKFLRELIPICSVDTDGNCNDDCPGCDHALFDYMRKYREKCIHYDTLCKRGTAVCVLTLNECNPEECSHIQFDLNE